MAIRRILQLGDPILHEVSQPVANPGEAAALLADMRDTLHEFQRTHGFGRGIAAVQIGRTARVLYMEYGGVEYSLINPDFVRMSEEKVQLWDDCFSFPDLLAWVERSATVAVRYTDPAGEQRTVEADGVFSMLIQHEMDHLDGILAVDRAIGPNGLATRAEYERQQAAGAPRSTSTPDKAPQTP